MRIVLSLDGSVLVPTLDPERFREYAAVITTLAESTTSVSSLGADLLRANSSM